MDKKDKLLWEIIKLLDIVKADIKAKTDNAKESIPDYRKDLTNKIWEYRELINKNQGGK